MFLHLFLENRRDLADFLNFPQYKFHYLLYKVGIDNLYTSFEIPKKNGEKRQINAPNVTLKYLQRKLTKLLWANEQEVWGEKLRRRNISHAFEKRKNIITNATIHKNKRYVLNIDLKDFFDSFHFGRVSGFFEKNRYYQLPHEVAIVIAQLTCFHGKLPQGAPSSPIITNLICQVLDYRILAKCKKYKLDYTRYADDLTFSTNHKKFLEEKDAFLIELRTVIEHAGFQINEAKTRLSYKSSRQVVTGLTVNSKLNISKEFYKNTRAMAYNLYKHGEFYINGENGTLQQLEGRFSFVNQIKQQSKGYCDKKESFRNLTNWEQQYQKFVFYKNFYGTETPMIITEGKTDAEYIKAALKKHYLDFPSLISKNSDGSFTFNFSFLKRSTRLECLFGFAKEGADAMVQLSNYFIGRNGLVNYIDIFKRICLHPPKCPVFMLFDNEMQSDDKPLKKMIKAHAIKDSNLEAFRKDLIVNLSSNLYLTTFQLANGLAECEIENLFDQDVLALEIDGKKLSLDNNFDNTKSFGKTVFARYISKNYEKVNFSNFFPLLMNVSKVVVDYKK